MEWSYQNNNNKLTIKEFKEKYPQYFKRDAEAQEAVEDISGWASIYKDPDQETIENSWMIQEALNYYPEGRIKSLLEDYYNGDSIGSLTKKYGIKDNKNTSVLIYKSKKRVLRRYIKERKTPIDSTQYVAIRLKVIQREKDASYCLKVGKLDLSEEPFWVSPDLIKLDDSVQDLLDYSEKYGQADYIRI